MTLWEANEKAREEWQSGNPGPYDNLYEDIRSVVLGDISVLLKNLPIEPMLDYVDFSEPGSFGGYAKEPLEVITEDEGYIDDMVYIDEPREKHIRRMDRGLGSLRGFPLEKYKNMPPPENESDTTEDEIEYLEGIPVDKNLVDSADEIRQHFQIFLSSKGLEYPKQELKELMVGVKTIILILKYHYNRPRPWQIAQAKGLELNSETLQSSSSPSYPSGHATQGKFVARYLSDLYPEYRDELMQIGEDIAYSRNMAKVHYPSDSAFGKLLGDEMYEFMRPPTLNEEIDITIKDDNHPYDSDEYDKFITYVVSELNIENPPTVYIEKEPTSEYTGGTYRYKGGSERIKVRCKGRSLMDILRSLAHELVHHKQKEDGKFKDKEEVKDIPEVGGPIEDEANALAGRLIKKYGQENEHLYEQVMVKKGDMLKSDIFKFLSNKFALTSTDYSEIKDNKGNYYRIIDMEDPYEPVNLSHLIEPVIEFVGHGVKSGTFEEEDIQKGIKAITDWLSLSMNQQTTLVN
jgi:hypothetical protein